MKKILSYLTPGNMKTQIKIMRSKSSSELLLGLLHFTMDSFFFTGSFTWWCTSTFCKFILRLMTGEPIGGLEMVDEEDEEAQSKALALVNPFTLPESSLPGPLPAPLVAIEAAPVPTAAELAAAEEAAAKEAAIQAAKEAAAAKAAEAAGEGTAPVDGAKADGGEPAAEPGAEESKAAEATPTTGAQVEAKKEEKREEKKEEKKEEGEEGAGSGVVLEEPEVPKQESPSILSSINFGNYIHRFVCFLARNFYNLKYIALFVAFMINFILLFYRVSVIDDEDDDGSGSGSLIDMISGSGSGSGLLDDDDGSGDSDSDEMASGEDLDGDGDPDEWIHIEEKYYYMNPMIRGLAIIHAILSFCMLVGYYHLKLPLGIFKREKEIARQMEFEGLFISEQPADDDIKGKFINYQLFVTN